MASSWGSGSRFFMMSSTMVMPSLMMLCILQHDEMMRVLSLSMTSTFHSPFFFTVSERSTSLRSSGNFEQFLILIKTISADLNFVAFTLFDDCLDVRSHLFDFADFGDFILVFVAASLFLLA